MFPSMYITNRFAESVDYTGPVILLFVMAMGIGLILGLINGFLITRFKLPAFVVTLGTSSAFYGLLISVLGGSQVNRLVEPLEKVSKFRLWVVTSGNSQTIIPVTFIFMVLIMGITWFILNKTMLGILQGVTASGFYESSDKIIKMLLALVTATGTVLAATGRPQSGSDFL